MEFRARYELIGMFGLAVIAGLFAFVYWLENIGGFGERTDYTVRFSVPVSGLAVGGGVFFNGIRVGEVTGLSLDPAAPERLDARIAVVRTTPVRADTKVGVSHQGLTGVADIMLSGGAADAAALAASDGGTHLLIADPAATRSWTESAARVLGRVDDLIGRNSERFDGIIAGLEKMTGAGGDKNAGLVYDLPAPQHLPEPAAPLQLQLAVAEPTVPLALNTDKLQLQPAPGVTRPLGEARFVDNLPNLFQARLIQGFENAGYMGSVLRPADAADPDGRLLVDIRAFHLATGGPQPKATVDVVARLIGRDGKVLGAAPFLAEAAAVSDEVPAAVAAFGAAFADAATRIIGWTANTLQTDVVAPHDGGTALP